MRFGAHVQSVHLHGACFGNFAEQAEISVFDGLFDQFEIFFGRFDPLVVVGGSLDDLLHSVSGTDLFFMTVDDDGNHADFPVRFFFNRLGKRRQVVCAFVPFDEPSEDRARGRS